MTNKFEVKYYNMYSSNTKVINLYKNDELVEAISITKEADINNIRYADTIKELVRNCYKRGLKVEENKRAEINKKSSSEDFCSFMKKPLTEHDIRYFYNRDHDLKKLKERCDEWNKKIGQDNDYSEIFKRVAGGN